MSESSPITTKEPGDTDNTDDQPILAVDPEDYQKTRRLKEIHRAKKDVQDFRRKRGEVIQRNGSDWKNMSGVDYYKRELSRLVAAYGSELVDMMDIAYEQGVLDDSDFMASLGPKYSEMDVREFIRFNGQLLDPDAEELVEVPEFNTLEVYRQLNRIMQKLGLGLELELETESEWEV